MHNKSIVREKILKRIIKEPEGKIRDLRHRVSGKKSEKKSSGKEGKSKNSTSKRPRGQQSGSKGHGRTERPYLPERKEDAQFPEAPVCPYCKKPYIPDESKIAEIIEIEVKAYTRKIKRQCMKKDCTCKGVPNTITAPMSPKVLPKSQYGLSIWEAVLLTKFHYCQPTNRLLNQYAELGLPKSCDRAEKFLWFRQPVEFAVGSDNVLNFSDHGFMRSKLQSLVEIISDRLCRKSWQST
jgi:transposase